MKQRLDGSQIRKIDCPVCGRELQASESILGGEPWLPFHLNIKVMRECRGSKKLYREAAKAAEESGDG